MAIYRADPDLHFLSLVDNADLDLLVSLLIRDPQDGNARVAETLTSTDEYKQHTPDHQRYWPSVAAELQTFGANSLVSLFRGGQGVPYREVLCDACDKMKVNYNKNATTENIELNMLLKVLENSLAKMSEQDLRELAKEMQVEISNPTPQLMLMAVQTAIRSSGFAAYRMTTMLVSILAKSLLGRALPFGAYVMLTRSISLLTGPVGWVLSSAWLAADIAGPAYRVTIPACMLVAWMRQKTQCQSH